MISCALLTLTTYRLFDRQRKPFGFFLGSLGGPFFHQTFEWFLFILFFTVLAFTHVNRSFLVALDKLRRKQRIAYRLCRLEHLHRVLLTTAVFRLFPASTWTGFVTSDFLLGYRWL